MKLSEKIIKTAKYCRAAKAKGVFEKVTGCWDKCMDETDEEHRKIIEYYCSGRISARKISGLTYADPATVSRTVRKFYLGFLNEINANGLNKDIKKLFGASEKMFTIPVPDVKI